MLSLHLHLRRLIPVTIFGARDIRCLLVVSDSQPKKKKN